MEKLAINWTMLESDSSKNFAGEDLGNIITDTLPYILGIAGFAALFYLIFAGFQYMMSGGDPKGMTQARNNITYAIIGLLLILGSFAIIQIMGRVLNIKVFQDMFQ